LAGLPDASPQGGKPLILVIDGEPQIHRFLGPALEAAGYEPLSALTADEGLAALARRPPAAVILDLGLPDEAARPTLARARDFYDGPILILSMRQSADEKIQALDLGADDSVDKPFAVGELLARLRAAMRNHRARMQKEATIEAGALRIDFARRLVTRHGVMVRLSPYEYELLTRLAQNAGRVLTHQQLLADIWGPHKVDRLQSLRVFIGHLRQKLEDDPANPRHIVTIAGIGYRFVA
jgi:two-component system KDP operon response regulator KdpE